MPAGPTRYISDRAFALDEETTARLNTRLEDFERETSNQLVVAIFANLPDQAEIAQYSTQVFRAWKVGQADKDNGVVLFIFKDSRKLFIATGRGLEGALPDVLCKQIIENEIVPRFKAGDFSGGIDSGVTAIISATKGEYVGTGKTVADGENTVFGPGMIFSFFQGLIILIVLIKLMKRIFGGGDTVMNRRGYTTTGGGWLSGGGSSGGSSWGGGGGGGFSGGGGSSGGGGAGGSW